MTRLLGGRRPVIWTPDQKLPSFSIVRTDFLQDERHVQRNDYQHKPKVKYLAALASIADSHH